jgi:hypothetical protein
VNRSKILGKVALGLCAVVTPMAVAIGGAAPAPADPGGLCVSGPFGYVDACVQAPGWVNWYDGPQWHGWGYGDGDDQGEDD